MSDRDGEREREREREKEKRRKRKRMRKMEGGLGGRDSLRLSIISLGSASLNNASGMWYR